MRPSLPLWCLPCPPSPLTALLSLFFLYLPFRPILSALLSSPLFSLCPVLFCVCGMCVEERTGDIKDMRHGRATLLWWGRGMEVCWPLLTGAKWCHAVPLSDHLSVCLASTQVIKVPCPSCEIKCHITKGQSGFMFYHIYCSCISTLFLPLLTAEKIMRLSTKKNNKTFTTFKTI